MPLTLGVFKRADVIRTRMGEIRGELDELEQKPDDEVTEEDTTRSTLLDEWDILDGELKPLEEQEKRLESVRARMLDAANREPGFDAPDVVPVRPRTDPFRDLPDRITMLGSLGRTVADPPATAARDWRGTSARQPCGPTTAAPASTRSTSTRPADRPRRLRDHGPLGRRDRRAGVDAVLVT